jgi:hypothetical protein
MLYPYKSSFMELLETPILSVHLEICGAQIYANSDLRVQALS